MRGKPSILIVSLVLIAFVYGTASYANDRLGDGRSEVLDRVRAHDGMALYVTGNYFVKEGFLDRGVPLMLTQALDPGTGDLLWEAGTWGPSGLSATGRAVATTADGEKLFVSGFTEVCLDWDDTRYPHDCLRATGAFHTAAYRAETGITLWETSLTGYTWGATGVAVSPSGETVYVTGGMDGDYFTVAYRAANGETLWTARYDGPASRGDSPSLVTVTGDGRIVLVSGESGVHRADPTGTPVVVAYDATSGDQRWVSRNGEIVYPGTDDGGAVAVNLDAARLR